MRCNTQKQFITFLAMVSSESTSALARESGLSLDASASVLAGARGTEVLSCKTNKKDTKQISVDETENIHKEVICNLNRHARIDPILTVKSVESNVGEACDSSGVLQQKVDANVSDLVASSILGCIDENALSGPLAKVGCLELADHRNVSSLGGIAHHN